MMRNLLLLCFALALGAGWRLAGLINTDSLSTFEVRLLSNSEKFDARKDCVKRSLGQRLVPFL